MTTERDALELIADLRAHLEAYPNDAVAREQLRRLAQEIDGGADHHRPIELSTWAGQPAPEPRRWLVRDWLPAGRVVLLTGPGGIGKSRLVLQLAAGVASGGDGHEDTWIEAPRDTLTLGTAVEPEGNAVVYASWEDEPEEIWRRLSQISGGAAPWVTPDRTSKFQVADMAGHGPIWAPQGGRHISAMAELTHAGYELRRHCEDLQASLLVLDPLAAAYAGDENARGLVRAFVSDWDAWGRANECAVLLVAHPPKTAGVTYAGSTDWHGAVRNMWTLEKAKRGNGPGKRQEDNRPDEWRLRCEKSNYGPEPEALHLEWDANGDEDLRWKVAGPWDTVSREPATAASTNGRGRHSDYD